jgi:hypothetical protein
LAAKSDASIICIFLGKIIGLTHNMWTKNKGKQYYFPVSRRVKYSFRRHATEQLSGFHEHDMKIEKSTCKHHQLFSLQLPFQSAFSLLSGEQSKLHKVFTHI